MKETEKCKKMGIHNYFLNRHFFPLWGRMKREKNE
jgi:hypothetical protein